MFIKGNHEDFEWLAKTQPTLCFFGHHHTRLDAEVAGKRCIGLNKVGYPGNLVAVEIAGARGRDCRVVAEWPPQANSATDDIGASRETAEPLPGVRGHKGAKGDMRMDARMAKRQTTDRPRTTRSKRALPPKIWCQ